MSHDGDTDDRGTLPLFPADVLDPPTLGEPVLAEPEPWLTELWTWVAENERDVLAVCERLAMVANGYSRPDERWAMSQIVCTKLAETFPGRMTVSEEQGHDLLFSLIDNGILRISVKIEQAIFQEMRKNGRALLKPRKITMTNARSRESAERPRDDFDVLLAIQRGPLKGGRREGRYMVRFGAVQNGLWLQEKYVTNKDSQQQVAIANEEWVQHGFLSGETEIEPVPSDLVRQMEHTVRTYRIWALDGLIGTQGWRL